MNYLEYLIPDPILVDKEIEISGIFHLSNPSAMPIQWSNAHLLSRNDEGYIHYIHYKFYDQKIYSIFIYDRFRSGNNITAKRLLFYLNKPLYGIIEIYKFSDVLLTIDGITITDMSYHAIVAENWTSSLVQEIIEKRNLKVSYTDSEKFFQTPMDEFIFLTEYKK